MGESACLYCELTKPLEAFNREHVLSEAFGRYEKNLVLKELVCEQCNTYFAQNLEPRLARGSYEGIERFKLGVAPKSKSRRSGVNHSTLQARRDGGLHDGAFYAWQIGDGGKVVPVKQFGIASNTAGPYTWYRLSESPTGDALRAQGFNTGETCFKFAGLTPEEASAFLTTLGYEPDGAPQALPEDVDSDGKVALNVTGTIDRVMLRAVAKIAFNYLIFHYPAIAEMAQFTPIRRYIRYDDDASFDPVGVSQRPMLGGVPEDRQLLAHMIAVGWKGSPEGVVAQVSLFSWVQYVVQLAPANFLVPPLCVDSGHIFDPFTLKIHKLTRHQALAIKEVPMEKRETQR